MSDRPIHLVLLAAWRRVRVIACPLCGALVLDDEREKHALSHDLQTRA
jgi:hypothetical protein